MQHAATVPAVPTANPTRVLLACGVAAGPVYVLAFGGAVVVAWAWISAVCARARSALTR
jgi:hypothetical protein